MTSTAAGPTLAEVFDVVAPTLSPALVAPAIQTELRRLATMLPPLTRAGFEVRLGTCPDVDLQQWLTTAGDEPRVLREHLSQRWDSPAMRGPAIRRLERFLSAWGDPAHHFHDEIGELWLEFDRAEAASADALPPISLFVELNDGGERGGLDVALRVLDALWPARGPRPLQANLERCFAACPDGALVSHIGLMLERPAPFVRVNIKRLPADNLSAYLRDVGWPGPLGEAVSEMSRTGPLVDGITLCLDVGDEMAARLGLEGTLDEQPPTSPRWAALLGALVDRGLCEPAKRDALLQWPGVITPPEAHAPWPAPLIRAELLRGADHFTAFERRLSHVKLTLGHGERPQAKVYFGFFHVWWRPALEPAGAPPPLKPIVSRPASPPAAGPSRPGREATMARAVAFLLASRDRSGWWRDFSGVLENGLRWRAGASDEWVTAFVATVLAALPDRPAQEAARQAWELLCRRRPPGAGWGYNRLMPSDADSTAWGLRLAVAVGAGLSPQARGARDVLGRHVAGDGGVSTYTLDAFASAPSPRRSAKDAYAGWAGASHVCVTSAAVPVLGDARALEFLRRSQHLDGSWLGYWWADPEYTTALAAEALAATGRADDPQRVGAAIAWGLGRLAGNGAVGQSPFATAWCLRLLALADTVSDPADTVRELTRGSTVHAVRESTRRATAWLRDQQEPDGGWAASARLLVPQPDTRDPGDRALEPTRTFDDARVFTTAAVLSALATGRP